MTEVISVKFKQGGKIYFFDPNGVTAKAGDNLVVETSKGLEYAICSDGNHMVEDTALIPPLRPVIRVATPEDTLRHEENCKKEKEAFTICENKILEHELDMKLVDVEYNFEGNKILFFFTSDGRVDFRDLVKDLAGIFKTRIELRQIGVRDEAKMLGGLGICGRPFCCSQFLDDFHPVSIKMAKTQGLSLNPTKISGTCGRLMCCLKYEQCAYEDLVKDAPKVDAFVETPAGKGSITSINLLRRTAKVRLEDGGDTTLKNFSFDELEVLGGKARRAEYLAAKADGTLEEAGFKESVITSPIAAFAAAEREKAARETPYFHMEYSLDEDASGKEEQKEPENTDSVKRSRNRRRKKTSGAKTAAPVKQEKASAAEKDPAKESSASEKQEGQQKSSGQNRKRSNSKRKPASQKTAGNNTAGTQATKESPAPEKALSSQQTSGDKPKSSQNRRRRYRPKKPANSNNQGAKPQQQ